MQGANPERVAAGAEPRHRINSEPLALPVAVLAPGAVSACMLLCKMLFTVLSACKLDVFSVHACDAMCIPTMHASSAILLEQCLFFFTVCWVVTGSLKSMQGYCYILTHPGTPCLFYDHLWTDGILRPSLWRRLRSLLTVRLPTSRREKFAKCVVCAGCKMCVKRANQGRVVVHVSVAYAGKQNTWCTHGCTHAIICKLGRTCRLRANLTGPRLGAWQVRQREGGHGAGSVSALRPLRAAILELLQLRRRAGLHALSQVLRATWQIARAVLCCMPHSVLRASHQMPCIGTYHI